MLLTHSAYYKQRGYRIIIIEQAFQHNIPDSHQ
jgi:hypothetical protein